MAPIVLLQLGHQIRPGLRADEDEEGVALKDAGRSGVGMFNQQGLQLGLTPNLTYAGVEEAGYTGIFDDPPRQPRPCPQPLRR